MLILLRPCAVLLPLPRSNAPVTKFHLGPGTKVIGGNLLYAYEDRPYTSLGTTSNESQLLSKVPVGKPISGDSMSRTAAEAAAALEAPPVSVSSPNSTMRSSGGVNSRLVDPVHAV